MPADKPTEPSRIKQNLNSTARPYDPRAFSLLDPTAVWHSHLALAIYMLVVINFDALARASDIRIERRQVVFLCWMQDSNLSGSQTPNRQQTECPLTNRLSYRGSAGIQPTTHTHTTHTHTHIHISLYIYIYVISGSNFYLPLGTPSILTNICLCIALR